MLNHLQTYSCRNPVVLVVKLIDKVSQIHAMARGNGEIWKQTSSHNIRFETKETVCFIIYLLHTHTTVGNGGRKICEAL